MLCDKLRQCCDCVHIVFIRVSVSQGQTSSISRYFFMLDKNSSIDYYIGKFDRIIFSEHIILLVTFHFYFQFHWISPKLSIPDIMIMFKLIRDHLVFPNPTTIMVHNKKL